MERQEVVSCTGSASSDLAKPGDDRFHDAVDTDSDDNEGTCAAMYIWDSFCENCPTVKML